MKSKRYDPGYHLELAARAQLLGVREGDPDETHTLLHGFVEEVGSGSRVEAETLDLIAWMIGRVLDGVDPAQVFSAPAREKDGGRTARQQLQKRRRERMIRLAAQDVRLELEQGGETETVIRRFAERSKLPKARIRAAMEADPQG